LVTADGRPFALKSELTTGLPLRWNKDLRFLKVGGQRRSLGPMHLRLPIQTAD